MSNMELARDLVRHDNDLASLFDELTVPPETKSGAPVAGSLDAIAAEIDRQGRAIETKQAADTAAARISAGRQKLLDLRVKRLELERAEFEKAKAASRDGRPDALDTEKIRRLEKATDALEAAEKRLAALEQKNRDLETRLARPPGLSSKGGTPASSDFGAWRAAQIHYLKTGETVHDGKSLFDLERRATKALATDSNPDGGLLLTPERDGGPIERLLQQLTPMRAVATVRTINAMSYKKPFNLGGASAGWVGERSARPETSTPQLTELEFHTRELYAMPAATQIMLDEMSDMEGWLGEEVQYAFAEQESTAYVSGTGVNDARGVLSYDKVANASWAWGKLGFVATGANGAFHATAPGDALQAVPYALKAGYRAAASWMLNRATIAEVRKIKDTTGQYLWQQNFQLGEPPSLIGYPVVEAEQMPDIAADSYSIGFGDWRRGYLIIDRAGIKVLRDPYTAKPHVLFYTTKRVGGGVQNFEAIKLLKFAA